MMLNLLLTFTLGLTTAYAREAVPESTTPPKQPVGNELPEEKNCPALIEESTYKTTTLHRLLYEDKCIPKGWEKFFLRTDIQDDLAKISETLNKDSQNAMLNPKLGWIFRAFYMVPPSKIKVIILGQDPAPQPGLATGLSFSLAPGVEPYRVQSVLRVILEAMNEGYCVNTGDGELVHWAQQGVLLLNTALTLRANEIASHLNLWKDFSKEVLKYINDNAPPSVWILWGSKAKYFKKYVNQDKHYIVQGGHPSPRANGKYFFCQNYYYCANQFLCDRGRGQVDWNLKPLPCYKNASRIYGWRKSAPGYSTKEPCEMAACPEYTKKLI